VCPFSKEGSYIKRPKRGGEEKEHFYSTRPNSWRGGGKKKKDNVEGEKMALGAERHRRKR